MRLGLFVIAEIVFGCLLAPPCPDPEFAPLRRPLRGDPDAVIRALLHDAVEDQA